MSTVFENTIFVFEDMRTGPQLAEKNLIVSRVLSSTTTVRTKFSVLESTLNIYYLLVYSRVHPGTQYPVLHAVDLQLYPVDLNLDY
jgi:hypothetical protein